MVWSLLFTHHLENSLKRAYVALIPCHVSKDTENLLDVLRIEGKIMDFSLVGSAVDPQA